jgi:NCS1 family nucleobase:cation symporter-1
VVRGRALEVDDLYLRGRGYGYSGGFNYRALAALAGGIAVALLGLVVLAVRWLYDYAWFVGFVVAGGLDWALMGGGGIWNKRSPSC